MAKFKPDQLMTQLQKSQRQLTKCVEHLRIPSSTEVTEDVHLALTDLEHAIALHGLHIERVSRRLGVEVTVS